MFLPHLSDRTLARARKHGSQTMKKRAAEVLQLSDPTFKTHAMLPPTLNNLQSEEDRLLLVRRAQRLDSSFESGDWCSAIKVIRDARVAKHNNRTSKQTVSEHAFQMLKRHKGKKLRETSLERSARPRNTAARRAIPSALISVVRCCC